MSVKVLTATRSPVIILSVPTTVNGVHGDLVVLLVEVVVKHKHVNVS